MNSKGSRVRVTYQDFADIIQEMNATAEPNWGDSRRPRFSCWGKLLSGRAEHCYLRPGLKLWLADFFLQQEIEIIGEFAQTAFTFVLKIEGSWTGIVTDHRGRSSELHVNPGLNVATVGPPQQYNVRMKGGQFHGGVRVEIADPFLSELFVGPEMEAAQLAQRISTPSKSRRLMIHRNLSPALEFMAY